MPGPATTTVSPINRPKRSHAELKRLAEAAVATVCGLPRPGLWLCVDEVEASGSPPERLRAWATLHFTAGGAPFCCGEPDCHLGLFTERLAEVGAELGQAMGLRHPVTFELGGLDASYHDGVWFQDEPPPNS